ncbi:MAG: hypothetical protein ACRDZO_26105 [Egibacteraceae bacterium]
MTVKLAITLLDKHVAAAKRVLTRRSADDELLDMLAEMKAEHGEPTKDDYAWAEQALGLR